MLRNLLMLLALLALVPAQAETVYVTDMLRVSVRAQPGSGGSAVTVLPSGTEMEVLERQAGYIRVRAVDGTEGWVSEGFITTEVPPRQRLAQLEKVHAQLQAELEHLRGNSTATGDQTAQMAAQVETLQAEIARLTTENTTLNKQLQARENNLLWPAIAVGMLVLFLLGNYSGTQRYKNRVRQRFGGLEI